MNQVELHPFFTQEELRAAHARLGIATQAWSPIGGVMRYFTDTPEAAQSPLSHSVVTGLAERHGRSPAQIVLCWHLEQNFSAIPKSVRAERISENFDVLDFSLSPEEVAAIDALNTGVRSGPNPEDIDTRGSASGSTTEPRPDGRTIRHGNRPHNRQEQSSQALEASPAQGA